MQRSSTAMSSLIERKTASHLSMLAQGSQLERHSHFATCSSKRQRAGVVLQLLQAWPQLSDQSSLSHMAIAGEPSRHVGPMANCQHFAPLSECDQMDLGLGELLRTRGLGRNALPWRTTELAMLPRQSAERPPGSCHEPFRILSALCEHP